MRCLTLADQLRVAGAEVAFVCRDQLGAMVDLLQARGYRMAVLTLTGEGDELRHADARETIKAAKHLFPDGVDWLVVDHYELDATWEGLLRPHAARIMVIDDLANRKHACEVLLDQNYSRGREQLYAALIPAECRLLVGPGYSLLRHEYADYRLARGPRDGSVGTVLVYFGGSDLHNLTGLSLEALSLADLQFLEVVVVVGPNNPYREAVERQAGRRLRTKFYGPRLHLADLMARADLSLGAGGATTWERMCLGLPSLVVCVADNQRFVSQELAQAGLIQYLGDASGVSITTLGNAIGQLIEDRDQVSALASKTRLLVDGLGTTRIADVLLARRASRFFGRA